MPESLGPPLPESPLRMQEFTNTSLLYVFVWYFAGPAVKEYEQLQEATITCMLKMEKFIVIIFARPSIL
jgi:hypothetical protein